jgi:hypothetical protein
MCSAHASPHEIERFLAALHALGGGDLRGLLGAECALPAEHPRLERRAMIEGQDVERPGITPSHETYPRSFR